MVNFLGWHYSSLSTDLNKKIASRQFCLFCCQKKKGTSGQDTIKSFNPKRKRHFFVAFIYRLVSSLAVNFFLLRSLVSASRRRALFFFLAKRSKTQGLDLMSDKLVKALFRQHKHPMKDRERTRCLGLWGNLNVSAKISTASPSIIS